MREAVPKYRDLIIKRINPFIRRVQLDPFNTSETARRLIEDYKRGDHNGAFWGIRTDFADYHLNDDPLDCLHRNPQPLADIPTRLEKMPSDVQDRLMNWGYAICDAALRAHIDVALQEKLKIEIRPSTEFPFAGGY